MMYYIAVYFILGGLFALISGCIILYVKGTEMELKKDTGSLTVFLIGIVVFWPLFLLSIEDFVSLISKLDSNDSDKTK